MNTRETTYYLIALVLALSFISAVTKPSDVITGLVSGKIEFADQQYKVSFISSRDIYEVHQNQETVANENWVVRQGLSLDYANKLAKFLNEGGGEKK